MDWRLGRLEPSRACRRSLLSTAPLCGGSARTHPGCRRWFATRPPHIPSRMPGRLGHLLPIGAYPLAPGSSIPTAASRAGLEDIEEAISLVRRVPAEHRLQDGTRCMNAPGCLKQPRFRAISAGEIGRLIAAHTITSAGLANAQAKKQRVSVPQGVGTGSVVRHCEGGELGLIP